QHAAGHRRASRRERHLHADLRRGRPLLRCPRVAALAPGGRAAREARLHLVTSAGGASPSAMTGSSPFPALFSPFRLRGVELRNRLVSTAHGTTMSVGGLPTEATAAYHARCARGGVGLIVLEAAAVHASAAYNPRFLSCCSDAALPGFRRIAEAVHAHGAAVFGQLYHPGASMRGQANGLRLVPVGP